MRRGEAHMPIAPLSRWTGAVLVLALMLVSAAAPLAGLVAAAAAETTTNTTTTVTVNVNVTSPGAEIEVQILTYSSLLRMTLQAMGLANATPDQVAQALGVNTTVAQELFHYANITVEQLRSMTLEEMQHTLQVLKQLYHIVTMTVEKQAAVSINTTRMVMEKVRLRAAERLAEVAQKLAHEVNDTVMLQLAQRLMEAVEKGNLTAVQRLEAQIVARMQASSVYHVALALNEALVNALEELAEKGNLTKAEVKMLEKLIRDVEKAQKIVEKVKIPVVSPDVLQRIAEAVAALSEANGTARIVATVGMARNGTVTAAAVAEAWAARLEARIQAALAVANASGVQKVVEMLREANATVAKALELVRQGDYAAALRELAKAEKLVVRAEAELRLTQMKELMKEFEIRHGMPSMPVLPVKEIVNITRKVMLRVTERILNTLMVRVEAMISRTQHLVAALNATNTTLEVGKLAEQAKEMLLEAQKLLEQAKEMLKEGKTAEAQMLLEEAMEKVTEAYSTAAAAMGVATVTGKAGEVMKHLEKIIEHVKKKAESIIEKMVNQTKKAVEEAKKKAEEAKKKAEEAKQKAEEKARQAAQQTGNETRKMAGMASNATRKMAGAAANATRTVVLKGVEMLNQTIQRFMKILETANETIVAGVAANTTSPEALQLVVNATSMLLEAQKLLEEAAKEAMAGNVTMAQQLLQEARNLVEEAKTLAQEVMQAAQGAMKGLEPEKILERLKKVSEKIAMLNQTIALALNASNGANATVVVNVTALSDAEALLQKALQLVENATNLVHEYAGNWNSTVAYQVAMMLQEAQKLLDEAMSMAAPQLPQIKQMIEQELAALQKRLEKLAGLLGNYNEAVEKLMGANITRIGDVDVAAMANALKAINETLVGALQAVNEATRLLAENNMTAALIVMQEAQKLVIELEKSMASLRGMAARMASEAMSSVNSELQKLAANITSLMGEIAKLQPQAAVNQTLAEMLAEAQKLLEEVQQILANVTAMIHGGGKGKAEARITVAVEAYISIEKAKSMVDKAYQLIQQVEQMLAAQQSSGNPGSSQGSPSNTTTPMPPMPSKP